MNTDRDGFVRRLERALEREAERAPSGSLDHRVRTALRTLPLVAGGPRHAPIAVGFAIGGLLCLVVAVAGRLAASGAATAGVAIGIEIALAYLALSAVVTLPLLLRPRRAPRGRRGTT